MIEIKNYINKNLYMTLEIDRFCDKNAIKVAYRTLSKKYHPDVNKDIDVEFFNEITNAYNILSNESDRAEYDMKSKFGNAYDELYSIMDTNFDFDFDKFKSNTDDFIKREVLDIVVKVDDTFDGTIEYERWVTCKTCDGSGKDLTSKILIRDLEGNIIKVFEAEDGCDFCEGTGKDYNDNKCYFCHGQGKTGMTPCSDCNGEMRILGKQKLKGIKLIDDVAKIDAMGHISKSNDGRCGYVLVRKIKSEI